MTMTPFKPGRSPTAAEIDPLAIKRKLGCTMEQAHQQATTLRKSRKVFVNDIYTVFVRDVDWPGVGPMKHLSIKRNDKEPIHDWRHLQQIKNMLVGPECEGVEIYPAESRLIDEANQYHLWVFTDPEIKIPIGPRNRIVAGQDTVSGAKQRPFEPPLSAFNEEEPVQQRVNRRMLEKHELGIVIDVSGCERTPEGYYVLTEFVDGKDYADCKTQEWIWSIGRRKTDGVLLASTDSHGVFYQHPDFECVWLR
jgi:hypothetical protein